MLSGTICNNDNGESRAFYLQITAWDDIYDYTWAENCRFY